MTKQFIYEFKGTILIEAKTQEEAEKLVMAIDLNKCVIAEDIYETGFSYIAVNPNKRLNQFGTSLHPIEDYDAYQDYKLRKHRYSGILNDFLNGKINKHQMIILMDQAERKDIPHLERMDTLEMFELKNGEFKTVRISSVGSMDSDLD